MTSLSILSKNGYYQESVSGWTDDMHRFAYLTRDPVIVVCVSNSVNYRIVDSNDNRRRASTF